MSEGTDSWLSAQSSIGLLPSALEKAKSEIVAEVLAQIRTDPRLSFGDTSESCPLVRPGTRVKLMLQTIGNSTIEYRLQTQIDALDQKDLWGRARLSELEAALPSKVSSTKFEKLARDGEEWREHFEGNAQLQVDLCGYVSRAMHAWAYHVTPGLSLRNLAEGVLRVQRQNKRQARASRNPADNAPAMRERRCYEPASVTARAFPK